MTELQFDKATPVEGGPKADLSTCASCGAALRTVYYQLDGAVVCSGCATKARASAKTGTAVGRVSRAVAWGGLGGVVGAGIWYAIRALTEYEVGLISILVGFLVGAGVRRGSGDRGGRRYQVLAVAITYLSITATYVPLVIAEFVKQGAQTEHDSTAAAAPGGTGETPVEAPGAASPESVPAASPAASPPAPAADSAGEMNPFVGLALAVIVTFVIAMAAPFLGLPENIIGLLIIGFGLHQAWTMNRRAEHVIEGPFRIALPASPPENPALPPS